MLDTNVVVAALFGRKNHSRELVEACVSSQMTPLLGTTLWNEYQDVIARTDVFEKAFSTADERDAVFDAFLASV